ncbi:hypothetical protein H920_07381 [Fukomys damarensis]|uniref:Uncharacterized protein n=1 Tax=Fukomys damarensis TaxID=885580 RepID=A0A091DLR5_FUKDA|nr:hypothetical protein H920_07381 [Fukomys damarensis]
MESGKPSWRRRRTGEKRLESDRKSPGGCHRCGAWDGVEGAWQKEEGLQYQLKKALVGQCEALLDRACPRVRIELRPFQTASVDDSQNPRTELPTRKTAVVLGPALGHRAGSTPAPPARNVLNSVGLCFLSRPTPLV